MAERLFSVLIAPDEVHVYSGMARPEPIEQASAMPTCLVDTLNRVPTGLQHFLILCRVWRVFPRTCTLV